MKTKIVKKRKISRITKINKNKKRKTVKNISRIMNGGAGINLSTTRHSSSRENWRSKSVDKKHKFSVKIPIILPEIEKLYYIEITNSLIHIKYKDLYIIINLDILSVDRLQYYINEDKLYSFDNNKNFLGLSKNTILLKALNKGSQSQYRTGYNRDFIDIYEDITINMISYEDNLNNLNDKLAYRFDNNVKIINGDLSKQTISAEDVSWLKSIMDDLNAQNSTNSTNIESYIDKLKKKTIDENSKIFTCNDLNIDHTKLIIDELIKDGEHYVIIGYPDQKMKSYLELLKNVENKRKIEAIYQEHKTEFMKYMAELHNVFNKKDKPEKHINHETKKSLEDEIHKFYGYEDYYKYIANFYENELLKGLTQSEKDTFKKSDVLQNPVNSEYGIKYDPEFQNKFKELQKAFYNELASKCLNKPMMKINYVFLIFKKYTKEGEYKNMYVPAVFNFRELKHKHHSILERVEYLIKTKLSKIYGIIEEETNKTKEDYKLWYSHYNYGDVFHIKTEYVHTMSNIQQQAYKYKNSISLEELIYMLSIPNVDLINLRLDYQRKETRFRVIEDINIDEQNIISNEQNIIKSLINKCNKFYKTVIENPENVDLKLLLNKNTKILLMFVETGNNYTFVYKSGIDNMFYIIKLIPNLCDIAVLLLNYLNKNKDFNKFHEEYEESKLLDLMKSLDIDTAFKLYEVEFNRPINSEDYKNIMRYNPLLVRTIKKIQNTPIISLSKFFQSPLIYDSSFTKLKLYNSEIPNPYNQKPLLIRNFLATKEYKDEFNKFKLKSNNNMSNSSITHEYISDPEQIHTPNNTYLFQFVGSNYSKKEINRIYFNPENCGFNLIETKEEKKRVIWVVPFNATMTEKLNDSFDDFKNIYDKNNEPKFIQNFMNLNNENHIKVLEIIKNKYATNIYSCFLNIGCITPQQVCLHIHVIDTNYYKSTFASLEQGSRLDKMLDIKKVINILKLNKSYYNEFICDVLLHDKI